MFMQKIEAPRVTCNLFDVVKGWTGTGSSSNAPRQAGEDEARAYADFIRRKCDLPELSRPALQSDTIGGGRGSRGHFYYVGATYGEQTAAAEYCSETRQRIPAQYEPGAFSVLFPGANQMRQAVTFETLGESGEVLTSSTMPVEPKKGGIVWGKDEVRKACGPVAKAAKAKRTPTVAKRRAAPTVAEQDKRRAAIMLALKLRAELRRVRAEARQKPEDCAAPVTPTHVAPMLSDAILSDLAAAEALMRGADYVAPKPRKVRAPGHERAILRAWAMRKARREAQFQAAEWEDAQHRAWSAGMGHKMARRRAVLRAASMRKALRTAQTHLRIGTGQYEHLKAELQRVTALEDCTRRLASEMSEESAKRMRAVQDQARLAEQEAAEALAMRDEMRGMLAALERRAEAAEAENAELWAEIEALTAPATPVQQGAIRVGHGAA